MIFFFLSFAGAAQTISVLDSQTNQPLAYVTVLFEDSGLYSDEKGQFSLPNREIEEVTIKHIGYENFYFKPSGEDETLFLKPTEIPLDEVIVSSPKIISKIDFQKRPRNFSHFPLRENQELLIKLIPDEKYDNKVVRSVSFQVKGDKHSSASHAIIRINVYSANMTSIFSTEAQTIDLRKDRTIDFYPGVFSFSKSGNYIGFELIICQPQDEDGSLNIVLTDKRIGGFSSETFLRYVFKEDKDSIPINQILSKMNPGHAIYRNLNLGLLLY